jgi:thymidylate kinase
MFIVFEGVDRCGKSTLSVEFQNWLNTEYLDNIGGITLDPELGPFVWTKEPSFTSAEADELNNLKDLSAQYKRELLFLESRIQHQDFLKQHNIVCDRYTWTGMVYAKVFSPGCFEFVKELYQSKKLFIQPDLYIRVNVNINTCIKRDPSLNMDTLLELWKSYELTSKVIEEMGIPILNINNEPRSENPDESIQLVLKELTDRFKAHLELVSGS